MLFGNDRNTLLTGLSDECWYIGFWSAIMDILFVQSIIPHCLRGTPFY